MAIRERHLRLREVANPAYIGTHRGRAQKVGEVFNLAQGAPEIANRARLLADALQ